MDRDDFIPHFADQLPKRDRVVRIGLELGIFKTRQASRILFIALHLFGSASQRSIDPLFIDVDPPLHIEFTEKLFMAFAKLFRIADWMKIVVENDFVFHMGCNVVCFPGGADSALPLRDERPPPSYLAGWWISLPGICSSVRYSSNESVSYGDF